MPRNPRNTDPASIRLITIRTFEAMFFLQPCAAVNEIIGGVLARYQEIYKIEIYAYVFLSNHFHLLIRAPHSNTHAFMCRVNQEISRRLRNYYNISGRFWHRRYDDHPCPTIQDALDALVYIMANPTNHGLVSDPSKWPGLHCIDHMKDYRDREFFFTHYSHLEESGEFYVSKHCLKLSPLPEATTVLADQSIAVLLRNRIMEIKTERAGKRFLEPEAIKRQQPTNRPKESKQSPKPICYSKCLETIITFTKEFKSWLAQYRKASFAFRTLQAKCDFPRFSISPPRFFSPRLA